jgi:hypothetical protein
MVLQKQAKDLFDQLEKNLYGKIGEGEYLFIIYHEKI